MRTFVISLARATQRCANITANLQQAGIQFEIVDAVDGETLNVDSIKHRLTNDQRKIQRNEGISPAEIGCFLSHYKIWEKIVAEAIPFSLVLEDDSVQHDIFFEVVQQIVASKYYWNIVHLSPSKLSTSASHIENYGKHSLMQFSHPESSTDSYLIDLDGAKKMLAYCFLIRDSIDCQWKWYWESNVYFYHVYPPVAWQTHAHSYIEHQRGTKKTKAQQKAEIGRWNYFWRSTKKRYARQWFHLTHPRKLRI